MSKLREQVAAFHEAMGVPTRYRPESIPDDRVRLRLKLIGEEFIELIAATMGTPEALGANNAEEAIREFRQIVDESPVKVDLVAVADALADLDYVIEGSRLEWGIDGGPIADEVQRSNMSKLVDGKPVVRDDGKILKGPNWSPPDIAGELRKQGWKE